MLAIGLGIVLMSVYSLRGMWRPRAKGGRRSGVRRRRKATMSRRRLDDFEAVALSEVEDEDTERMEALRAESESEESEMELPLRPSKLSHPDLYEGAQATPSTATGQLTQPSRATRSRSSSTSSKPTCKGGGKARATPKKSRKCDGSVGGSRTRKGKQVDDNLAQIL